MNGNLSGQEIAKFLKGIGIGDELEICYEILLSDGETGVCKETIFGKSTHAIVGNIRFSLTNGNILWSNSNLSCWYYNSSPVIWVKEV